VFSEHFGCFFAGLCREFGGKEVVEGILRKSAGQTHDGERGIAFAFLCIFFVGLSDTGVICYEVIGAC
jgi:hypothetical protein